MYGRREIRYRKYNDLAADRLAKTKDGRPDRDAHALWN